MKRALACLTTDIPAEPWEIQGSAGEAKGNRKVKAEKGCRETREGEAYAKGKALPSASRAMKNVQRRE